MSDLDRNHDKRKELTLKVLKDIKDPEHVLQLAPEIWKIWDSNKVIPEGMTYNGFYYHLEQIYLLTAMGRV